ncbi:unnamed protein product [Cylicocyclus nassatus]|uniref:Uncharacterized protein n=1 Tax=Cylicocyclus nassatus TaxID=53992 RepID=A0AA36GRU4_CYLNA|nr:unnamed protein product [Cylicocyclus nassatus]
MCKVIEDFGFCEKTTKIRMHWAGLFLIVIALSSARAVKVKYSLKPEKACKDIHTQGYQRLIIDSVTIYHTDDNNRIIDAAWTDTNCNMAKECRGTFTLNSQKKLKGPLLTYDSKGRYHIVLGVRHTQPARESPVTYFCTSYAIKDNKQRPSNKEFDEKLYHLDPFLIGEVEVSVDGHKVITRRSDAKRCFDSYSWIADHGIYRLYDDQWITMYYYPHYYPQVLS